MKQMQKTFFALGTVNSVSVVYDESRESQIAEILNRIKLRIFVLDDMFSLFKENSEITRINKAAGSMLVEVSPETYHVIEKAIEFSKCSDGAFDISAGSLSQLWRTAKKENKIPDRKTIKKYTQLVNYQDIILQDKKAGLSRKGQKLDLGGIAKGYAADEAKRILAEEHITNAIINFGGTVIAMGDEKQIGVQNPDAETGIAAGVLKIREQAVVTSGLYERYFVKDGYQYHHIINTKTGMPSKSGLLSVSVIGDSALEMDALATAVFIMGFKTGIKLIEKYHAEAVFMDEARNIFLTKGLVDKFRKYEKEMVHHGY